MRIRSIKPEFWRSDAVNAMSIEDRLLFIGLWSYVDDNGVGVDRVSDVCADLFAHDLSVSPHGVLTQVAGGLNRLHALGVIERYSVGGKRFLEVSNWSEHQRINRPSPGRYPRSDDPNAEIHAPLTEDSLRTHADALPGAGEQGNRGTGESTHASQLLVAGDAKLKSANWRDDEDNRERAIDDRHSAIADEQRARAAQADVERDAIDRCTLCDTRGYAGGRVCEHDPEVSARARRGIDAARRAIGGDA